MNGMRPNLCGKKKKGGLKKGGRGDLMRGGVGNRQWRENQRK